MDAIEALHGSRVTACRAYLAALTKYRHCDWTTTHAVFKRGEMTLAEAFALAHPEHYSGHILEVRVRGPRTFPPLPTAVEAECGSRLIWGYECSLPGGFAADHIFPWSLGGPTDPTNRVTLCTTHNQLKGSDVHAYPWERGRPTWLEPLLDRVAQVLRGALPSSP